MDKYADIPAAGETWKNKKDVSYFLITAVHGDKVYARWEKGTTAYTWKLDKFLKHFEKVSK